jgi:ribosomal protein L37E
MKKINHHKLNLRMPHPPHWYKITTEECVACGAGGTTRERVYGKKPVNPQERYHYEQYLCSRCMVGDY